jgi:D-serine/D-alanine/glycine transporter
MDVFLILTSWDTTLLMVVWILILLSYFKFRRNFANLHDKSIFKAPFGKISATILVIVYLFIAVSIFYDEVKHVGADLGLATVIILGAVYMMRTSNVQHIEDIE